MADAPLVETVAQVMGDVLHVAPLDPGEDFFASGGDSLRATQVAARLAERYAEPDSPAAAALRADLILSIFDGGTPAELAEVLAEALAEALAEPPARPAGERPA